MAKGLLNKIISNEDLFNGQEWQGPPEWLELGKKIRTDNEQGLTEKEAIELLLKYYKRNGGKGLPKEVVEELQQYNNGTQATGGEDAGEANAEAQVEQPKVEGSQSSTVPTQETLPPVVKPELEANAEPKKDNPGGGAEPSEDPSPKTKAKAKVSDKDKTNTDKKTDKEEKAERSPWPTLWEAMAYLNDEFKLISNVIKDILNVAGGFLILPPLKRYLIYPVRDFLGTHLPNFIRLGFAVMFKKLGEKIGVTDKRISMVKNTIKTPFVALNQKMENYWRGEDEGEGEGKGKGKDKDKDKKQDKGEEESLEPHERKHSDHTSSSTIEDLEDREKEYREINNPTEASEHAEDTYMFTGMQYDDPEGIAELFNKTTFNPDPTNKHISTGNETWITNANAKFDASTFKDIESPKGIDNSESLDTSTKGTIKKANQKHKGTGKGKGGLSV